MIKAIIIDDEPDIRDMHRMMLEDNFPEVEIVGESGEVNQGIELIQSKQPQIVLLDIEIEGGTGFNILQQCKPYDFKVIFITAFDKYGIKAIKFSAFDYILKPVNEFEFTNAVQNAINSINTEGTTIQYQTLLDSYYKRTPFNRVVLRTASTMYLTNIEEIFYCQSDNSYTTFYIKDKQPVTVSRNIKEYSEMFEEYNFVRPHQSYLVNLQWIDKVDKTDGGFIVMQNGKEIPIATRRMQGLMQKLSLI